MFKELSLGVEDSIAIITLDRPESNNSFNEHLFQEVIDVLTQCEQDGDVKVIIITGAGKNFSSGGDINAMATFDFITPDLSALAGRMTGLVKKCSKPVIAMINGVAAGAACALALACDFRIMATGSSLITAFGNVALSGDSGSMYHLYQIVGLAKTIELMMLSKPVKGEEALRLGLATILVEDGSLEKDTIEFAELLKTRSLGAFARQKQIFYDIFYHDYEEYLRLEGKLFVESAKTEDHHEAVTAFLEKRNPVFKGK